MIERRIGAVRVGDLVLSEGLARGYAADEWGRIVFRPHFVRAYLQVALYSALISRRELPRDVAECYYASAEPTYTYEAAARLVSQRHGVGRAFLSAEAGMWHVRAADLGRDPYANAVFPQPHTQVWREPGLTPELRASALDRVSRRIGGEPDLYYMRHVLERVRATKVQAPDPDHGTGRCVCVWLHDFGDGEQYFGFDGYETTLHWTLETLRTLTTPHGWTVLVKVHPTQAARANDTRCLERVRQAFPETDRVRWIDPFLSTLKVVEGFGVGFGVTRHGTVAEELGSLGVPVVASWYSPYGANFRIANTWRTPQEQTSILSGALVDPGILFVPDREELADFAASRYLTATGQPEDVLFDYAGRIRVPEAESTTVEEIGRAVMGPELFRHLQQRGTPTISRGRRRAPERASKSPDIGPMTDGWMAERRPVVLEVAGLARDCAGGLERRIQDATRALAAEAEVRWTIFENDSTDETPDVLRAVKNDLAVPVEIVTEVGLVSRIPIREERIAHCRNVLLERILERGQIPRSAAGGPGAPVTLYVPIDLDIEVDWEAQGPALGKAVAALVAGELDGVFPAARPRYYDIFALRARGWVEEDCWVRVRRLPKRLKTWGKRRYIHRKQIALGRLAARGPLVEVESAFGGLGLYRLEAVEHQRYSVTTHDGCEHVAFNRGAGRLAIATDLIVKAPSEHLGPD